MSALLLTLLALWRMNLQHRTRCSEGLQHLIYAMLLLALVQAVEDYCSQGGLLATGQGQLEAAKMVQADV
jgi:hypothetical protein